nr:MAG TPA: hypothetical protein [Caudoviricetes sp.]
MTTRLAFSYKTLKQSSNYCKLYDMTLTDITRWYL